MISCWRWGAHSRKRAILRWPVSRGHGREERLPTPGQPNYVLKPTGAHPPRRPLARDSLAAARGYFLHIPELLAARRRLNTVR